MGRSRKPLWAPVHRGFESLPPRCTRRIHQGAFLFPPRPLRAAHPQGALKSTHWSSLSGAPDSPENYHTVTYTLSDKGASTEVTITQDNNAAKEEKAHSEKNWQTVLEGLKDLLES